jgi:two-component system cell cycle sensor histidine kinase/response regulator CckA
MTALARYTLLLVEDNPGDVLLLEETLSEVAAGEFRTSHAGTLAEATRLLRRHRFDAVLLDLGLPDSTGLPTLSAVQSAAAGVPVLVLTGMDDEKAALDAVHLGAQDYLVKGQVFGTMLARTIRHAIERARTEQSLHEAEERFRELADHVSSVFWLASADGRELLFVTPAFEALTGRSRESAYADPCGCLDVVHPDDRPRIQARLAALPPAWDDEYRIVRPDGEVRWVHDRGHPVRAPGGEVTRLTGVVEDVTEARAAREKIRLQAGLLDAVGESVIATRLDGTVFYWNRAAEQLYGWTADEAAGRSIMDLICPQMAWEQGQEVMARLSAGQSWQGEFPVSRRDGSCFPAYVTDAPILDAEGRLIGIIGASTDLTARKRAEQAVRDSEARYRALFESMAQGVVLLGAENQVLSANPAALEILGVRAEEMLGRSVGGLGLRLVDEEGRPLSLDDAPVAEVRRTGRPVQRVIGVFNQREGRCRWLLVNARPHEACTDDGGACVFSTFTDITAEREAQAEVRQAHQSLDTVLNTTPLATIVVDRGGTVRLWNPAAERMFGWTAAEVVGGPYPLEPLGDTPPPQAIFEDAWDGVRWKGTAVRRRTRDGRALDLNLWNAPLTGPDGEIVGLLGVLADVSERKELEAKFLQAQKMEAVGRLAGGVAHDFNNMLTAIIGHTELLLAQARQESDVHADLVEVRNAAVRAASLTRQLLAFSRKQVLQPQVLDLNAVVGETQRMLERLIGEDVELAVALNAGQATVRADRGQLEQVLVNLAVNARDAMPAGGVLSIETDVVLITPEQARRYPHDVRPGAYVRLSVADSGVGMPEEVLARMFEPFFTTKEVGRGTGLGLSTVYGIVKQSGGYVWAESTVGEGSTFRVYLPSVREPVARPPAEDGRGDADRGSETVLLVEDDQAVRALAARILASRGYRVLRAADGAEALEMLEKGCLVDLILTDVVLPRMSGLELARASAALPGAPPVLFMSGYTEQAPAAHELAERRLDLIEKPFSPVQLAHRVRKALDRARAAVAPV